MIQARKAFKQSRDSLRTDIKLITTLHHKPKTPKPYACEGSLSPASRTHFSKTLSETLLQEDLGFRRVWGFSGFGSLRLIATLMGKWIQRIVPI